VPVAFLNPDRAVVFGYASDIILHDRGVAVAVADNDAVGAGFGAAYDMVLRDSGVDAPANYDPASDIARDTVSHNSSVASGENVDHERTTVVPLACNLEAPDREPRNAHIANALYDLAGFGIKVALDANSLRCSDSLRAGRVRFGFGGRFDNGVLSAQLDPVLANYHVLSVNSLYHDSVARMGGVYGPLDGLTRPNDRALRSGGAAPTAKATPLAKTSVAAITTKRRITPRILHSFPRE
jgi:hypothetical protein